LPYRMSCHFRQFYRTLRAAAMDTGKRMPMRRLSHRAVIQNLSLRVPVLCSTSRRCLVWRVANGMMACKEGEEKEEEKEKEKEEKEEEKEEEE
jgi:hypothetical protein